MPIYKPNRRFEGSDMGASGSSTILRSDVRTINFRDEANKSGVKLFILGPYKQDSEGNGVWYKVVRIRDNFGLDTKTKFPIPPNCPVEWFAAKVKSYAPNYAKVQEEVKDGKKMKVYPSFGRTTYRVIYNSAYVNKPELGAHVLDIPQYNCASVIHDWCADPEKPMLNEPDAAIPVEFVLKSNVQGNPWNVTVNAVKAYKLPETLVDSDYLYDLDESVAYPDIEKLYEDLRRNTPSDIFNKCMADYVDDSPKKVKKIHTQTASLPVVEDLSQTTEEAEEEDNVPMQFSKPAKTVVATPSYSPTMPSPGKVRKTQPAPVVQEDEDEEDGGMPSAPVSSNASSSIDIEAAKAFLRRPGKQSSN